MHGISPRITIFHLIVSLNFLSDTWERMTYLFFTFITTLYHDIDHAKVVMTLFLFVLFTVPLVCSPGPVNILLAGLGANHGIRKNLLFVGGLICSATLISIACLIGLQVFLQNKIVYRGLIIAGLFYIMYLAIKLYRLQPQNIEKNAVKHRFKDGLLVTSLNPKFYVMVTAVFAQFVGPSTNSVVFVVFGFVFILLVAHIGWLSAGSMLKETTSNARHLQVFNKIMGASLFLFALYFLYRM